MQLSVLYARSRGVHNKISLDLFTETQAKYGRPKHQPPARHQTAAEATIKPISSCVYCDRATQKPHPSATCALTPVQDRSPVVNTKHLKLESRFRFLYVTVQCTPTVIKGLKVTKKITSETEFLMYTALK